MNKSTIHTLRLALNQEQVVGSEQFKDKIEATLNRSVRSVLPGRPRNDGVKEEEGDYVVY